MGQIREADISRVCMCVEMILLKLSKNRSGNLPKSEKLTSLECVSMCVHVCRGGGGGGYSQDFTIVACNVILTESNQPVFSLFL